MHSPILVESHEHDQVEWLDYGEARGKLTWDSNRTALWELGERLAKLSRIRRPPVDRL